MHETVEGWLFLPNMPSVHVWGKNRSPFLLLITSIYPLFSSALSPSKFTNVCTPGVEDNSFSFFFSSWNKGQINLTLCSLNQSFNKGGFQFLILLRVQLVRIVWYSPNLVIVMIRTIFTWLFPLNSMHIFASNPPFLIHLLSVTAFCSIYP